MINLAIAALAGLLCFILLLLFVSKGRQGSDQQAIQNRMAQISGLELTLQNAQTRPKDKAFYLKKLQRLIKRLTATSSKNKYNSLDLKMQQAGLPLLGAEFRTLVLLVGAAGGLLTILLTMDPMGFVLGFGVSVIMCFLLVNLRISRRRTAFANQLGDMLTMIANALRAGFSFMQALEHIANEMDDPVKTEVRRVVREVSMGLTLEEALENMGTRLKSTDFDLVIAAVLIQRQVGGNLAQILDTISATINERLRMRREINTLTVQGKMSGVILAALPLVLAGILSFISPGYLDPMLNDPIGQMALVVIVVLDVMAFVVIRSIMDIDL